MHVEVHHGGNSWNNVAQLHPLMSIANTSHVEVMPPEKAQKYGLVKDIEVDVEGVVHAWDAPGVGRRWTWRW
jgi:hypothetical protein